MTQQPINYTIEEVDGLLDPANKVSLSPHPPLRLPLKIILVRPPPQLVATASAAGVVHL